MNSESKKWIETLKQVCLNPYVKVLCPHCNIEFIHIIIIPWSNDEQKIDVHLICENCKSRNVFTKDAEI